MTDLLAHVAEYEAAGLCLVPVKADGTKAPDVAWLRLKTTRSTPDEHREWFGGGRQVGVGVVYGQVSGNVEMVEFEGRAVREGVLAEAAEVMAASGLGDVWQAIAGGWVTESPSGGSHFRVRVDGDPVPGNTKLAQRLARPDEYTDEERRRLATRPGAKILRGLVETRGEGGYGVVEPSGGTVHASGRPWRRVAGSPATIPTVPAELVQAVRDVCRMFDTVPKTEAPSVEPRAPRPLPDGAVRPGDDYENRTAWEHPTLLGGWTLVHRGGQTSYWRRPGKDRGVSATTGRAADRDRLYVFSTSTEFEAEVPYSKFGAYALLHHGGDHASAARDLAARGFGTQRADSAAIDVDDLARFVADGGPAEKVGGRLVYCCRQVAGAPDREALAKAFVRAAVRRGMPAGDAVNAAVYALRTPKRTAC